MVTLSHRITPSCSDDPLRVTVPIIFLVLLLFRRNLAEEYFIVAYSSLAECGGNASPWVKKSKRPGDRMSGRAENIPCTSSPP